MVEHDLAKVGVASSSLVFRSFFFALSKRSLNWGPRRTASESDSSWGEGVAQYVALYERGARSRASVDASRAGGEIGIHATLRG